MSERDYVKMIGHNETITHPVDVISDIYTLMPSVRLTNANAPVVSRLIGTFKFAEWVIHSVGSPIEPFIQDEHVYADPDDPFLPVPTFTDLYDPGTAVQTPAPLRFNVLGVNRSYKYGCLHPMVIHQNK